MTAVRQIIRGVGVSPGVVVGPVRRMPDPVPEPDAGARVAEPDRASEAGRITEAAAAVRADLAARASAVTGDARDVLEATALMADDPTLTDAAAALVTAEGLTAQRGVWQAGSEVAATMAALGGYLGERARDVTDVRDRIVARLTGRAAPGIPVADEPFVLVAADLAPADTATLDPTQVLALVTESGGPTSHTAILARALGLPAIVAASGVLALPDGAPVLVDGGAGTVVPDPSPRDQERAAALRSAASLAFSGHGVTGSGTPIALLANVGDAAGALVAASTGAQGVGLFRTEFCFLDRREPPTVAEQVEAYTAVLDAFTGRRVVVRTLDAGADKPLPFVTDAAEANPALGVRGLRTAARAPRLLDDQLTAIAEAARGRDDVWVMAPMVATAAEAHDFVTRCATRGLRTAGVMVEVPAAALCADAVLEHAAFASIGTNDLAQYCMAADRQLGELAALNDPWQPAVLRLVELTCRAGRRRSRPVGVCGEAAADPALACVLAGLGVSSLSMSPRALGPVAAALAGAADDACAAAAEAALAAPSAADARAGARALLPHLADVGL